MSIKNRFRTFLAVSICLLAATSVTQAQYSGGTGEPNDPYQIAMATDLIALGETPDDYGKHFILTADIDLDPNLPGGKVFDRAVIAPDANDANWRIDGEPFWGFFDGNDHTISHLTITGGSYLGLCGQLDSGANISNLGLEAVDVSGDRAIGGLVGENYGSITTCHSTARVNGDGGDSQVGGLAGYNYGSITASYSTCMVSGGGDSLFAGVGGLVCTNFGTITTSCSTGSVRGEGYVGGLVGANHGDIISSYSTGTVSGSSGPYYAGVGGLVGTNGRNITSSYSTGKVSGEGNVGGLVGLAEWRSPYGGGHNIYDGTTTASFWDAETCGQLSSAGGTGLTTAEMQTATTFLDAGWDFMDETDNGPNDVWKIVEGQTYPLLSWQKYGGGTGEPNDPYLIYTAEHLNALGAEPNDYDKHFRLMADIDLSGYSYDRAVIAPDVDEVKERYQGTPFTGGFDGNGQTISNLAVAGKSYLGLFGKIGIHWLDEVPKGRVGNLEMEAIDVNGTGHVVGGLVGMNCGTLTMCYSNGIVRGDAAVGGLAGHNCLLIIDCYSSSEVHGIGGKSSIRQSGGVGGLVGCNSARSIVNSVGIVNGHSSSTVRGDSCVGGLVGINIGEIHESYFTGQVYGDHAVGGLAGIDYLNTFGGYISGWIWGSYNAGIVTGNNCVGGLIGNSSGIIRASYNMGVVEGISVVGGLVGSRVFTGDHTSPDIYFGHINSCYNTGAVAGETQTGGLVGSTWSDATAVSSYWNIETSGQLESASGTGLTTAEMQTATTYLEAGWDFIDEIENGTEGIWKIAEGLDYPRLWWEEYDGQVTLEVGQRFTVTLESNPSTGYRWEWVDSQESILEQIGEAEFKPRETGDPPLVGAGGWEIFTFEAVSPGQMTLELVYRRPWEEGMEPLKTFSLQVVVP